jgi:hypothetical protein
MAATSCCYSRRHGRAPVCCLPGKLQPAFFGWLFLAEEEVARNSGYGGSGGRCCFGGCGVCGRCGVRLKGRLSTGRIRGTGPSALY